MCVCVCKTHRGVLLVLVYSVALTVASVNSVYFQRSTYFKCILSLEMSEHQLSCGEKELGVLVCRQAVRMFTLTVLHLNVCIELSRFITSYCDQCISNHIPKRVHWEYVLITPDSSIWESLFEPGRMCSYVQLLNNFIQSPFFLVFVEVGFLS